jgi:hypothetical protein
MSTSRTRETADCPPPRRTAAIGVEQLGNGELRLWDPTEAERGMPRIAMLELAGTRI